MFVCGLFLFDAFVCSVCALLCGVVCFCLCGCLRLCVWCCVFVCVVFGNIHVYCCGLSVMYGVKCCAVCVYLCDGV